MSRPQPSFMDHLPSEVGPACHDGTARSKESCTVTRRHPRPPQNRDAATTPASAVVIGAASRGSEVPHGKKSAGRARIVGCDCRVVITAVAQGHMGRLPRIFSRNSASSSARHTPMMRNSPTGRHSRSRWPSAAIPWPAQLRRRGAGRLLLGRSLWHAGGQLDQELLHRLFLSFSSGLVSSGEEGFATVCEGPLPPSPGGLRLHDRHAGDLPCLGCAPAGLPILWALADPELGEREILAAVLGGRRRHRRRRPRLPPGHRQGFCLQAIRAGQCPRGAQRYCGRPACER